MLKMLDYSNLDLADRRSVERVVEGFRTRSMSRTGLVRGLVPLGYAEDGVVRYVDLVEATLDEGAPDARPSWASS